jgi:hypothetical protein
VNTIHVSSRFGVGARRHRRVRSRAGRPVRVVPRAGLWPVNYATTKTPRRYRCDTCGAKGCKLWREYQTMACYTELVCCDCAGKSQEKDVSEIDADGYRPTEYGRTDQIGWRIPAVPTEEGDTFWGYSSVPDDGVKWWRALPTRSVGGAK